MEIDSVIAEHSGVNTFSDLGMQPTSLDDVATSVLHKHRKIVERVEDW